jgi:hypothetical protein
MDNPAKKMTLGDLVALVGEDVEINSLKLYGSFRGKLRAVVIDVLIIYTSEGIYGVKFEDVVDLTVKKEVKG